MAEVFELSILKSLRDEANGIIPPANLHLRALLSRGGGATLQAFEELRRKMYYDSGFWDMAVFRSLKRGQPTMGLFKLLSARSAPTVGLLDSVTKLREAASSHVKLKQIDAAAFKRAFQQSEPRITINIFLGDNHGD